MDAWGRSIFGGACELQQRPYELTCQPLLGFCNGKLEKLLKAFGYPQRNSWQKVRHPCMENKTCRGLSETLDKPDSVKAFTYEDNKVSWGTYLHSSTTLFRKDMALGPDSEKKCMWFQCLFSGCVAHDLLPKNQHFTAAPTKHDIGIGLQGATTCKKCGM